MKHTLILLSLLVTSVAQAACLYSPSKENTVISWTAFKTPKKVGVGGKFDSFEMKSTDTSSIEKALETATFTIDTKSVNTANPGRDKTIVTHFFTKDGKAIALSGKLKSLKGSEAVLALTFNGVTKDVPMTYVNKDNKATLNGKIEMMDFALNDQFNAIHKACKALHEGKTWTDVEIAVTADFSKSCK